MKTLDEIKEEVSEFDWWADLTPEKENELWPEICKRYAAAEYNEAIEDVILSATRAANLIMITIEELEKLKKL